jgi:NADH dehydrogenase
MTILIVGGSGRVGKEVTLALARRGLKVSALLRGGLNHPRSGELSAAGVDIIEGDLAKAESLKPAMKGVETVICSATSMPSGVNDGLRRVDHEGTLALIDVAEREGVKKFVYISYSGNIRFDSPLEVAKRDCEDRLKRSQMQTVILRPSMFMEVWLSPMLGFDPANGSARVYGPGTAKMSYISSSNVAEFAVETATRVLNERHTVLEVGGPEAVPQLDAVRIFGEAFGKELKIESVPVESIRAQHKSFDPVARTFGALMLAYVEGDEVVNAAETAGQYGVKLRSVAEFASSAAAQQLAAMRG